MSLRIPVWRLTAVLLAGVLLVAATGCGKDDNTSNGGGGTAQLTSVPGFDGSTITLGVITPLSGPVAVIGNPLTAGNQLWFDYLNAEKGGIAGKYKVKLVQRDNRYDPATSVQAYNRLKNDVVSFVQILGTPIVNALLPQLKADGQTASPASLDAEWIKQPNLMPIQAPYQIQAVNALFFYLRREGKSGDKKICSMYQDDPYGQAGREGLDFAAEKLDFKIASTAKYRLGDKDFTGQIGQLKRAACDAVFLTGVPSDMGGVLGTAAQSKFAPRWIGQSPVWVEALGKSPLRPYLEKTLWVVGEGPQYGDTSVPGMRDLMARLTKYPPKLKVAPGDLYLGYGYNQGRVLTAVLEKAVADGDLSHQGILKAIQEVGTISFDGLAGDYTYGPIDQREPPRLSTIFKVNPAKSFGLEALKTNFSSGAAKEYEFKK